MRCLIDETTQSPANLGVPPYKYTYRQTIDYQDLGCAALHGLFLIESHQNHPIPSVVVEPSLSPWRSYPLYDSRSFSKRLKE